ncbi:arylamine N-acetyltransferase [Siccirubricoccus sp. G192]|uniref:arylamine N-acetyltransferase family protein n=1 Tax=Siccirubricoccus sp. G192 TaxID=2849651 RepID=UPI001C2C5981|nr:arylamine N-acetyltransferase [Siccirubricoccus sp. G192]MBV1799753.1 arylamine N-acetyltransferase [Siccirubricoccus sp. G192]
MSRYPDLAAYFARIGHAGAAEPTLTVLRALHAHHPASIVFEGLDPFLGRPVSLDPAAIEAKLVQGRRGGYCHEQNGLFHDVLAALGFSVTALGGRVVWMRPGRAAPLTHRLTLVDLAEGRFIADVGFGGQGPTAPLRLEPGLEQPTPHGTYRLLREGEVFEAQMRLPDRWEAMYRFTLAPQAPADFEMANWFTATHPRTRFTRNLVAARVVGAARASLFNATLSTRHPDGSLEQRSLRDAQDLGQVLEEVMGLDLPVPAAAIWARLPEQPVPPWP